jgi:hypothetical protein
VLKRTTGHLAQTLKQLKCEFVQGTSGKPPLCSIPARRQANHPKNGIEIERPAKSIRKQVQLLPAPLTPRNQICRSVHLKHRARCTQKYMTERIMIEDPMQIAA